MRLYNELPIPKDSGNDVWCCSLNKMEVQDQGPFETKDDIGKYPKKYLSMIYKFNFPSPYRYG